VAFIPPQFGPPPELPMNDALAGQYGSRPRQHLADGGFAKLDDIEALAQNGVETFTPVPKPRNADRDRHVPQPSDPPGVADWRTRMGGLHRLHRLGDDDAIDREFSAVCRAIWSFTLDDFTDDDLSAQDHAWLDQLTKACAIDFAAKQGYDLKDYIHGGCVAD
jgi:hypothetical protein